MVISFIPSMTRVDHATTSFLGIHSREFLQETSNEGLLAQVREFLLSKGIEKHGLSWFALRLVHDEGASVFVEVSLSLTSFIAACVAAPSNA